MDAAAQAQHEVDPEPTMDSESVFGPTTPDRNNTGYWQLNRGHV